MRVVVFGATGTTGRLTVRKLLTADDKHTVVAVARNPAALDDLKQDLDADAGQRLVIAKGDLMDAASVAAAVHGAHVVVFAAGVASIKQAASQKTTVYSISGKNVLDAMAAAGVKRLVAVTSHGVVSDPSEVFVYRWIKPLLMRDMYDDMIKMESIIQEAAASGRLSSTIIRPTKLEDGAIAGGKQPAVGEGLLPKGSLHSVNRDDVAALVVDAVHDEAAYSGKVLYISV